MANPVLAAQHAAEAQSVIATHLDALRAANSISQAQRTKVATHQDPHDPANPVYQLAVLEALAAAVASLESRVA
jgi:hypothetical protein